VHRLRQTETVDGRERVIETVAHEVRNLMDEQELRRLGHQFALPGQIGAVRVHHCVAVAVRIEADVEFGVAQRSDRLRRFPDDLLRGRF
jgi:hypothetical protein